MLVYIWVKIGQEPPNKNCIKVVGFWVTSFQMKLCLIFLWLQECYRLTVNKQLQKGKNEHKPLSKSLF